MAKPPSTVDGIDNLLLCDWLRFCAVGQNVSNIRDWAPRLLPGSPGPSGKVYHYWLWCNNHQACDGPVRVAVTQSAAGAVLDIGGAELRRMSPAMQRVVHRSLLESVSGLSKITSSRLDWAVQRPVHTVDIDRVLFRALVDAYGFSSEALDGVPYLIASTTGETWQAARQDQVPGRRGAVDRFRLVSYTAPGPSGLLYRRFEVREHLSNRSSQAFGPTSLAADMLSTVAYKDVTVDWAKTEIKRLEADTQGSRPMMRRAVSLALRALGYEPRGGGNRVLHGRASETDTVLALAAVTEGGLEAAVERWPILRGIAEIEARRVEVVEPKKVEKTLDLFDRSG